jgi:hypothetical protein
MPDANEGVAFAPDGTLLATAAWDDVDARVVSVATGEDLTTLPPARRVAFSPDGSLAVTAAFGPVAQLWETASWEPSGDPLDISGAPTESSEAVGFSPDGSMLALLDSRATVRVWRTDDRTLIEAWQANSGIGKALAWDPRGIVLVTGGADGAAVWTTPSFELERILSGGGKVNDVAYNADGTRMATVSQQGALKIWDTGSWQEVLNLPTTEPLVGVAFAPHGASVTTASETGQLRVYTLDLARLLSIAAQRVSRPLTDGECLQYLHAACESADPALGQPVPAPGGQATVLDGAYQVTLTKPEWRATGWPPDAADWDQGSYTLALLDGTFRLTHDNPYQSGLTRWGTYEVSGDRMVLTEVSDALCAGARYEGTWRLESASFTLRDLEVTDTEECDGWAKIVFTSEPWTRLGELAA